MWHRAKNADKRMDIGTWGFLGLGWWVSHLAAIAAVGLMGYFVRKMVR